MNLFTILRPAYLDIDTPIGRQEATMMVKGRGRFHPDGNISTAFQSYVDKSQCHRATLKLTDLARRSHFWNKNVDLWAYLAVKKSR